jgi:hypothetical protein
MTRHWKITEKVIAIFFIIWGAVLLSFEIHGWYQIFQFTHISWQDFSSTKFLKNYHLDFLLLSLTLFSGIMLFIEKRAGWILSASISLFTPFNYLIYLYFNSDVERSFYIAYFCIAVVFWTIFILLISKPIRMNYYSNKFAWKYLAIIFIIFLTDKFVFHNDYESDRKFRITEKQILKEFDSLSKPIDFQDTIK